MKTLNERLLAARDYIKLAATSVNDQRPEVADAIDAIEEAASDALLTDTALYLPLPLVLIQQKEYEARISSLESQLTAMTAARDDAVAAAKIATFGNI